MKAARKNISYYSRRGQELILVLHALWELRGGNRKSETITYINQSHYFALHRSDIPSYDGTNEPRWNTLLAWARKDGVLKGGIANDERDYWEITRKGREILDKAKERFSSKVRDVRLCYLWTPTFKKLMDPDYIPSDKDKKRPDDGLELSDI